MFLWLCLSTSKILYATVNIFILVRGSSFNTINQHFIDFLHNERVNFPCGWPDSDMGPIEPYNVEEFDVIIESSSEFSS